MDTYCGYKKGDKIRCKMDFTIHGQGESQTLLKKGKLYTLYSFQIYQANMICEDGKILPMEDDEMRDFFKMKKYTPKPSKQTNGIYGYSGQYENNNNYSGISGT
jgi:hypothetical protein